MALWFFSILAFTIVILLLTILILMTHRLFISHKPCLLKIGEESLSTVTGQTLLQALQDKDFSIPSPCGGKGSCLQCRVRILGKTPPPLDIERVAFTRHELEEGFRLACQTKVQGDIAIESPMHHGKKWKATLVEERFLASFVKELVCEVEEAIDYPAGSYFLIEAEPFQLHSSALKESMEEKFRLEWERYDLFDVDLDFRDISRVARAYSIASYPAEGRILKFNVRLALPPIKKGKVSSRPWGLCSTYLFSLKKGSLIDLQGPFGQYHAPHENSEVFFLIGGVGSSFARSYIYYLLKTEKRKGKISLWYGARNLKEVIYREEFETLSKEHPSFSYHIVLSEPNDEDKKALWPIDDEVKTNYLYKAFEMGYLKEMKEPESASYYVCGPPAHNSHVLKLLDDYGVPRENIVLDDFGL